eukprot:126624-Pyramimonas_sp.AAC.1
MPRQPLQLWPNADFMKSNIMKLSLFHIVHIFALGGLTKSTSAMRRRGGDIHIAQQAAVRAKKQRRDLAAAQKQFDSAIVVRTTPSQLARRDEDCELLQSPLVTDLGKAFDVWQRGTHMRGEYIEGPMVQFFLDRGAGCVVSTDAEKASKLGLDAYGLQKHVARYASAILNLEKYIRRWLVRSIDTHSSARLCHLVDSIGFDGASFYISGTSDTRFIKASNETSVVVADSQLDKIFVKGRGAKRTKLLLTERSYGMLAAVATPDGD